MEKRRRDWRLGRWTAKAAVSGWLAVAPARIEILATAEGAPIVLVDGEAAGVAISLSHRADRALAVIGAAGCAIGCDLEAVAPRSDAFVREWLTEAERTAVNAVAGEKRDRLANLIWTAKEAAAKLHPQNRLFETRTAVTELKPMANPARWRPLRVSWPDGAAAKGWCRAEPAWVMAVAGDPPPAAPQELR
jgi:4'-phosphopantetheinyl transferase